MKRKRKSAYTLVRTKYKQCLCNYVADRIHNDYKRNGNKGMKSYNSYLRLCSNYFKLNSQEVESIYNKVDDILEKKYRLLLAHSSRTDNLYLVNLKEQINE